MTNVPGIAVPPARTRSVHADWVEKARQSLAWARDWRLRMRPQFDAIYGVESRCPTCGCRS